MMSHQIVDVYVDLLVVAFSQRRIKFLQFMQTVPRLCQLGLLFAL